MSEIFMAGPDISKEDEEIILDALAHGWYGSKKLTNMLKSLNLNLQNITIENMA